MACVAQEYQAQYVRAMFDIFPSPSFIVGPDLEVRDFNSAAESFLAESFLGRDPEKVLLRRGGEVFHCLQAEMDGCGNSEACESCVIRNSVDKALGGEIIQRRSHEAWLRTRGGVRRIELLVSTGLLPYTDEPRVLLVLEERPGSPEDV